MNLEFLSPIEDIAVAHTAFLSELSLGKTIRMHTKKSGLPDLDGVQIALIGVPESRNSVDNAGAAKGIEQVRKFFLISVIDHCFSSGPLIIAIAIPIHVFV